MEKEEIEYYVDQLDRIVNTHCHHLGKEFYTNISLHQLIGMTYIGWMYPPFEDTEPERKKLIDTMCSNTYFRWFAKAVGELYGNGEPLNEDNWDRYDNEIKKAYGRSDYDKWVMTEKCRYYKIILDNYKNPGDNLGWDAVAAPAFRCDMFLFGFDQWGHDENGNCATDVLNYRPDTLSDYCKAVEQAIISKKKAGCLCLKIAIAYERGLDFELVGEDRAEPLYNKTDISEADKKVFQDYMMGYLTKTAAKLQMPIQIHTGLGGMEKSSCRYLVPLIKNNPNAQFVIFHCSYPWTDDALGLIHNFSNVVIDLCWLPLISTKRCIDFLKEALEVGDITRICWGCDTWTAEESYGALLAIRHVFECVFARPEELGLSDAQVRTVISNIMYENAKRIYRIED